MAIQWKRRIRAVMVCTALLSVAPTATAAVRESPLDASTLPDATLDADWLLGDHADAYLWLLEDDPYDAYAANLCNMTLGTLTEAQVTDEENETSDPDAEWGIDPLQYHECRYVRDEVQEEMWEAYGNDTSSYACYRPSAPLFSSSPLPFSICYGTDVYECDILVQHIANTCLGGIFPPE